MNKKFNTQQLVKAAMIIALGLIIPQAFHSVKNAGSVFLPMHIPVLLAGFFVDPVLALCVGILTPILSFLFTGMPPFPILYVMIIELGTYGLVTAIAYNKFKFNLYVSLLSGMICGRIMSIMGNLIILHLLLSKSFSFVKVASGLFVTGIPGIVIQLILIPVIVFGVNKATKGAVNNNG